MAKRKLVQPAYQGYRYVPAGVCKDHYTFLSIFVRYCTSATPSKIVIKRKTASYIWLVCPDRELVIGYDNHLLDSFNPDMFDECLHFDLFNDKVAETFGLNYAMPNFVHDRNERKSSGCREFGNSKPLSDPKRMTILSDSGGFQYASGVIDYINPKELGEWYKKNTDAGMVLDIPLRKSLGLDWVTKLAKLQNRNTSFLKEVVGDKVELININQGKTLHERQLYRDIVEEGHPDLERFALGGAVVGNTPLLYTDYILDVALTGKSYKQYHVLGTTSSATFPILIALAHHGDNPPHITSDSTSHKQAGLNRKIYTQTRPGFLRMTDLGLIAGPTNTGWHLKCSCPVCSVVKYRDILGILPGQFALSLMSLHNVYETNNYVQLMQQAFTDLTIPEYMDFVKGTHCTSSPRDSKELIHSIDFTIRALEDGLDVARKRYRSQIDKSAAKYLQSQQSSKPPGLFGEVEGEANPGDYLKLVEKLYATSETNLDKLERGEEVTTGG